MSKIYITTVERMFNCQDSLKFEIMRGLRLEAIAILDCDEILKNRYYTHRKINGLYTRFNKWNPDSMYQGIIAGQDINPIYNISYAELYWIIGTILGVWVDVEDYFYTLNINKFVAQLYLSDSKALDAEIREIIANGK